MCVGEFEPKVQETSKYDPRYECPTMYKDKMAHYTASHVKECNPQARRDVINPWQHFLDELDVFTRIHGPTRASELC